jgi:hypothetical protein
LGIEKRTSTLFCLRFKSTASPTAIISSAPRVCPEVTFVMCARAAFTSIEPVADLAACAFHAGGFAAMRFLQLAFLAVLFVLGFAILGWRVFLLVLAIGVLRMWAAEGRRRRSKPKRHDS